MFQSTRLSSRSVHGVMSTALSISLLFFASACDHGDSTHLGVPHMDTFGLVEARVLVDGESIGGQTISRADNLGSSTRFEARVVDLDANLSVEVAYQRPQMMEGSSGIVPLFDDGTHGDAVAGDGIYCFEDWEGEYGLHMSEAPMGVYHYAFYAMDEDGHHSNHLSLDITLSP